MYKIITIEAVKNFDTLPEKRVGKRWYRYTIANGYNTITGFRPGTRIEIQKFVNSCIIELNKKFAPSGKKYLKPVQQGLNYA